MADEKQGGGASEAFSKGASAAKTIQGAVKTGKAIAGMAKGAAAGGPYGAVAMGLWQNRKTVVKIILAAAFIMILPILFILMLPSLIFGGLKSTDSPEIPVMNDNTAIYANIEDVNMKVYEFLSEEHKAILDKVQKEVDALPSNDEHEIIDLFNASGALDTNILISQYCASRDNYEDIDTNDLLSVIKKHKDKLFAWSEVVETKEITRTVETEVEKTITEYVDSIVTDAQGIKRTEKIPVQKTVIVKETKEETVTVEMHTYTISFVGSDYYASDVFRLDEEKTELAKNYAENLVTFLEDRDNEMIASNDTHKNIIDLIKDDTTAYTESVFEAVLENWKSNVTSEFGNRSDPFNGSISFHSGIDIGVPIGTSIYAVADGTVLYVKKSSTGYGYHLAINHGSKVVTLYAHCSELLVTDGDTVKKGHEIAKSGSTGRSTGPHLHFEVMVDGVLKNPRDYLP